MKVSPESSVSFFLLAHGLGHVREHTHKALVELVTEYWKKGYEEGKHDSSTGTKESIQSEQK